MRTWRIVSLIFGVVGLLTITFIATTPLRFPGYEILWGSILTTFIPILVIIEILPLRIRLSHTHFTLILLVCVLLFLGLSIVGYMVWTFLVMLLLPLLGMFIASRALSEMDSQV